MFIDVYQMKSFNCNYMLTSNFEADEETEDGFIFEEFGKESDQLISLVYQRTPQWN